MSQFETGVISNFQDTMYIQAHPESHIKVGSQHIPTPCFQ